MAHHDWLFVRGGEWVRRLDGVRVTLKHDGWQVENASGELVRNPESDRGTFKDLEVVRVACDTGKLAPAVLGLEERV
jgi:hypothetical protein